MFLNYFMRWRLNRLSVSEHLKGFMGMVVMVTRRVMNAKNGLQMRVLLV